MLLEGVEQYMHVLYLYVNLKHIFLEVYVNSQLRSMMLAYLTATGQTGLTCISWRVGRGPAGCPARWTGCLRRGRCGPPSPVQSTAEGSHVSVPAPDTGTAAD